MTHPKAGEWWCPGKWCGQVECADSYAGCDGDPSCDVCHGQPMVTVLEGRVQSLSWADREMRTYKGRMLCGWANLMASRYGRPVYLVGGALKDALPRDIDVRVVLSATEYEARFGDWREWGYNLTNVERMDEQRRWHVEIAKMNKQGAGSTHLPIDFQVEPILEASKYMNERRLRLDDLPGLVPPWED